MLQCYQECSSAARNAPVFVIQVLPLKVPMHLLIISHQDYPGAQINRLSNLGNPLVVPPGPLQTPLVVPPGPLQFACASGIAIDATCCAALKPEGSSTRFRLGGLPQAEQGCDGDPCN